MERLLQNCVFNKIILVLIIVAGLAKGVFFLFLFSSSSYITTVAGDHKENRHCHGKR